MLMGELAAVGGCPAKMVTLRHVPVGATTGYEIHEFLAQEALILDHQQYSDWATLLARDLKYRCPSRLFTAAGGMAEPSTDVSRDYDHDFVVRHARSLNSAADQSQVKSVRRLITNVIIASGDSAKEYCVTSYVLVTAAIGTFAGLPLMTIERRDMLRRCSYTYQIVRREVGLSAASMDMLRAARVV